MRDTLPEAFRVQTLVQRRLGGERRLRLACEMSRTLREMARERIAAHHPSLDERGILAELMRELYGTQRVA